MRNNPKKLAESRKYNAYENTESVKQTQLIKALVLITSVVSISLLIAVLGNKPTIFFGAPVGLDKLLVRDICFQGFDSITKKSASSEFVVSQYASNLESSDYKGVDISPETKDYRLIQKVSDSKCKIAIKTKTTNKRNLRVFVVDLSRDPSFTFGMKVSAVSEVLLNDSDRRF